MANAVVFSYTHTTVLNAAANMIMLIESMSVMKIKTKELLCKGLHDTPWRVKMTSPSQGITIPRRQGSSKAGMHTKKITGNATNTQKGHQHY